MQELRLVLIIVGAVAIAALLFHGLWISKKESKNKFSQASLGADSASVEDGLADEEYHGSLRSGESDTPFGLQRSFSDDPLGVDEPVSTTEEQAFSVDNAHDEDIPHITLGDDFSAEEDEKEIIFSDGDDVISKPRKVHTESSPASAATPSFEEVEEVVPEVIQEEEDDELQVIALNVHCVGEEPFVGTKLFDSMQQNGLIYGDMDIFHRHSDLSGNGKVLFSVANMMQPGTLQHDDPAAFTTKGISFFMTLPGFGDPEQNFKLMLRTAQQIADDLGGNVLDDKRHLMTPDKLAAYRGQIRAYQASKAPVHS